jgi:hypothetical protein
MNVITMYVFIVVYLPENILLSVFPVCDSLSLPNANAPAKFKDTTVAPPRGNFHAIAKDDVNTKH